MKTGTETDAPAGPADRAGLIARHWTEQGTPFIAGKAAVTLDGRTATRTGDSQWITGEGARTDVMQWRRVFPAIAVGADTVLSDNPRLTARIGDEPDWCPVRFVFDGRLRTAAGPGLPQVYTDAFRARTIVVTTPHGGTAARRRLEEQGVQVWSFATPGPRVPPADFRRRCADEGIRGVFVEGGSDLLGQFLVACELDYLLVYHGPLLLADDEAKPVFSGRRTERLVDAIRLEGVHHEIFEGGPLTRGHVAYPERRVRGTNPAGPGSSLPHLGA